MLIPIYFLIIALMRVIQKICTKQVSGEIKGSGFFHYSGYYQLLAAVFALITLTLKGFSEISWPMAACAVLMSFFLAINIFANLEVLKSTSLVVNQMFSTGSVIVTAIAGILIFGESLNVYAWTGIVCFLIAFYCILAKPTDKDAPVKEKKKFTAKTLILLIIELISVGMQTIIQKWFGAYVIPANADSGLVSSMNASFNLLSFAFNALFLYACYLIYALIKDGKKASEQEPASEEKVIKPLSKTALISGALLAFALFAIGMLATLIQREISISSFTTISLAISIGITIIISTTVYKEKLTTLNVIGIVLGILSVLVINFQNAISAFLSGFFG